MYTVRDFQGLHVHVHLSWGLEGVKRDYMYTCHGLEGVKRISGGYMYMYTCQMLTGEERGLVRQV